MVRPLSKDDQDGVRYQRPQAVKNNGGENSTHAHHMKDARFTIPTPALLSMDDPDTKGDVYEYMLGKIATAGSCDGCSAYTAVKPRVP